MARDAMTRLMRTVKTHLRSAGASAWCGASAPYGNTTADPDRVTCLHCKRAAEWVKNAAKETP